MSSKKKQKNKKIKNYPRESYPNRYIDPATKQLFDNIRDAEETLPDLIIDLETGTHWIRKAPHKGLIPTRK